MSRLSRHSITGSEVGRPRPMAYMRRGRTRRTRSAGPTARTRGRVLLLSVLLLMIVCATLLALRL